MIQQHNDTPSVIQDSLRAVSGLHMQHMAVWVEISRRVREAALAKGWVIVQESDPGPGEFCYLIHPDEPALIFEISDRNPSKEHSREVVQWVAENWDGTDPIRDGFPRL